ncbi:MAG: TetR/AcrR family transcriptional regulator [Candidatus Thorarchaeota archaeon]|jgi:AcrR family transcriptional regulator
MKKGEKKFRRDKESKIESVISSWNDLIAERGYAGFSINDIPERAGLSIGTIYRYFPQGKIDILKEAMSRNIARLTEELDLDSIEESEFADMWIEVIRRYVKLRRDDMLFGIAMRDTSTTSPELARDLTPIVVNFYASFTKRFLGFRQFKDWPKEKLMLRLHAAFNIMGSIRELHLRRPLFDADEELVEYLLGIVLLTFEVR